MGYALDCDIDSDGDSPERSWDAITTCIAGLLTLAVGRVRLEDVVYGGRPCPSTSVFIDAEGHGFE